MLEQRYELRGCDHFNIIKLGNSLYNFDRMMLNEKAYNTYVHMYI